MSYNKFNIVNKKSRSCKVIYHKNQITTSFFFCILLIFQECLIDIYNYNKGNNNL